MRTLGLEDTGKRKALQVSLEDFLTTYIVDCWANKGGVASIRERNVQGKTQGWAWHDAWRGGWGHW
jgi:hypothetical protein